MAVQTGFAEIEITPPLGTHKIGWLKQSVSTEVLSHCRDSVLCVSGCTIVGVPGEFFCELGLQIKERAWPVQAWISTCTNDRVGYIPTLDAFRRGGYETTLGPSSMLAPETGSMIVDTAIALIEQVAPID